VETTVDRPRRTAGRRSPLRRAALLVLAVGAIAAIATVAMYPRQVVSYLTHLKGGPTTTWPYVAHDPPPELHIAVVGDVGDSGRRIDATGAAAARVAEGEPYDVMLFLGDNVYPSGDPAKLPGTVFGPFADVLDGGAELLAILGNHDVEAGWGDAQMDALGMPSRHWSRQRGDVVIVGLDSTRPTDPEQIEFLERTLAATTATWRIVALHHPPYSAGYQGSSTNVREIYSPIFERYGVQLVLSGHDHDYQRSVAIDGVTYVVSGAGAGTRRTGDDAFTAASYSWHHFVDIAVVGDRLTLRAVGQDGSVFDEVVLRADAS
jgi:3',5'-cyclic AMP phosphodiesterase CpdA